MSPAKIGLLIGCVLYGALFGVMLAAYLAKPSDELIFLTIVGLPLSLLFLWLASAAWTATAQAAAIGLCGLVQFGALGYLAGRLFSKRRVHVKEPHAP